MNSHATEPLLTGFVFVLTAAGYFLLRKTRNSAAQKSEK